MKEIPVTIKRSIELLGLFLIGAIIVIGKIIIMPLLMSFFVSIMLLPVYRFFRKRKFPDALAVFLPVLLTIIVAALIVWLFYNQTSFLLNDYHQIEKNLTIHLNALSVWIGRVFGFSPTEQLKFIKAGTMTGVAGMFLALPVIAVLKIIFDRTGQYKKWGVLLGDEKPAKKPIHFPGYPATKKISS